MGQLSAILETPHTLHCAGILNDPVLFLSDLLTLSLSLTFGLCLHLFWHLAHFVFPAVCQIIWRWPLFTLPSPLPNLFFFIALLFLFFVLWVNVGHGIQKTLREKIAEWEYWWGGKKNTAEGAGEVTCTLAALFPHSVKFLKCTREAK